VPFNQYEPLDHEFKKLERELLERNLPVYLGAWMSRNVSLLEDCVGYPLDHAVVDYDLVEYLHGLQDRFSPDGYYLSLLSFKGSWETVLPDDELLPGFPDKRTRVMAADDFSKESENRKSTALCGFPLVSKGDTRSDSAG
jgi:hypothetical protein